MTDPRPKKRPPRPRAPEQAPIPHLPERAVDAHKGHFGLALLVGGSRGMAGAMGLAGMAALRGGAGLVRLAVPDVCLDTIAAFEPSYMTAPLPSDPAGRIALAARQRIVQLAEPATVVACGPGMGRSLGLDVLVGWLYANLSKPMVVDADGLNALAACDNLPSPSGRGGGGEGSRRRAGRVSKESCADPAASHPHPAASPPPSPRGRGDYFKIRFEVLSRPGGPRILTPHPGELARLLGTDRVPPEKREAEAVRLAKRCGVVIVLKGHQTLITDGDKRAINPTGNPGMATGGSGDVLTGLITALACQGLSPFDAAQLGVYLHGLAGDLAAEQLGQESLMASDLVRFLPAAFKRHSNQPCQS